MPDLEPEARMWELERLNVMAAGERESLEARLAHAAMHLSVLTTENVRLAGELQTTRDRMAATAEELMRSESERLRLESLLGDANVIAVETKAVLDDTKAELETVRTRLADALGEVDSLKTTISWRVTAPLRAAKEKTKRRGDQRRR